MHKKRHIVYLVLALLAVLLVVGVVLWIRNSKHASNSYFPTRVKHYRDGGDVYYDEGYQDGFFLETEEYFRLMVNDDTAFFIIDSICDNLILGRYYPLEAGSNCVSTHSFLIKANQNSCRLLLDKQEFILAVKGKDVADLLDENTHSIQIQDGDSLTFSINRHVSEGFFYRGINERGIASANSTDKFREEYCDVQMIEEGYANNMGYWSSMSDFESKGYGKLVAQGLKNSLKKDRVKCDLDIYLPRKNDKDKCPVIFFVHGGAFYVGDKREPHIMKWCDHFCKMGYVCVSVNYRMGFLPTRKSIESAIGDACMDLHDAVSMVTSHCNDYNIDTNYMFAAGTSAGAIMALQRVFCAEQKHHCVAVANMWGAMTDLSKLKNSNTSIVSFHGDADNIVPYAEGYPFAEIRDGKLGKSLFGKMYGSKAIHEEALRLGKRSKLYTFPGQGHALHLGPDRSLNMENMKFIQDSMAAFFYDAMIPQKCRIVQCSDDPRHYTLYPKNVNEVKWCVHEGFILKSKGCDVWVTFIDRDKADNRCVLIANGTYPCGVNFHASIPTDFEDYFTDN